jgi:hypothetical protein
MGEYEPDDSRTVTQSPHQAPGEPPRTGPRDDEARAAAQGHKPPQEKQGVADPEPEDEPTARDALGKKQPGFAGGQQEQREGEASDEEPPLGK